MPPVTGLQRHVDFCIAYRQIIEQALMHNFDDICTGIANQRGNGSQGTGLVGQGDT